MRSPGEFEEHAQRVRRALASKQLSSDAKIVFGATFLVSLAGRSGATFEVYLREFLPSLSEVAKQVQPGQLLPRERKILADLLTSAKDSAASKHLGPEIALLSSLAEEGRAKASALEHASMTAHAPGGKVVQVQCLFVEDYPDIGLSSRGRILQLQVTGFLLPDATEDDIIVTNPLEQPDDPFLEQARESVVAVRLLLAKSHGLSPDQHFQVKFAIDSTGARFTGDSLGVAFAVGAIALVSQLAVMRQIASIQTNVSFSGALDRTGGLKTISLDGLKLKVERAFHSAISHLVIPQEHLSEVRQYLKELEREDPARKLEIIGAENLEQVISDSRLVAWKQASYISHVARKVAARVRTKWVELPILVALSVLLIFLVLYLSDRTPAELRFDGQQTRVVNQYGYTLWSLPQWGDTPYTFVNAKLSDVNGDGEPEVLFIPSSGSVSENAGWLYVFSPGGDSLMALDGRICQVYPGDTISCSEALGDLWCGVFAARVDGVMRIVTVVNRNSPGRCYIKIWDNDGRLHGWYINSGASQLEWAQDVTGDGREELLFTGFANRMHGCAAWFLPAESACGVSPPYTHEPGDPDLTQVPRGNQISYTVIFPSDVGNILSPQEHQGGLKAEKTERDGIRIISGEGLAPLTGAETWLFYDFDRQFKLRAVSFDDHFKKERRLLMEKGQLPQMEAGPYLDSLARRVSHWTDSGWVFEGQLRDHVTQVNP